MQRPIGFWVKLVDRLIDQGFDSLLQQQHLTRRHWQVLNMLAGGPRTVEEIDRQVAPFLDSRAPSARPVLEELRERGWVVSSADDRAELSAAGHQVHGDLNRSVQAQRQRVAAGISSEEYNATLDVLRRMAENLGWVDHPRRPD